MYIYIPLINTAQVDETTLKLIAFLFPKLKELVFRHYTESTVSCVIALSIRLLHIKWYVVGQRVYETAVEFATRKFIHETV